MLDFRIWGIPKIQECAFGGGSEAPQAARSDKKAWIFKKTPFWGGSEAPQAARRDRKARIFKKRLFGGVPKRRRQLGGTEKLVTGMETGKYVSGDPLRIAYFAPNIGQKPGPGVGGG